jgi:hypothetical protein
MSFFVRYCTNLTNDQTNEQNEHTDSVLYKNNLLIFSNNFHDHLAKRGFGGVTAVAFFLQPLFSSSAEATDGAKLTGWMKWYC